MARRPPSRARERAELARRFGAGILLNLAVGGWVVAGLFAALNLPESWRGACWGASAVLGVGGGPALVQSAVSGNRRAADAGLPGS